MFNNNNNNNNDDDDDDDDDHNNDNDNHNNNKWLPKEIVVTINKCVISYSFINWDMGPWL